MIIYHHIWQLRKQAQKGEAICLRSHSWEQEKLGLEPKMLLVGTNASSQLGQKEGSKSLATVLEFGVSPRWVPSCFALYGFSLPIYTKWC